MKIKTTGAIGCSVLHVGLVVGALDLQLIGREFDLPVASLSCNIGKLSPAGSLNQVPASAGVKAGMLTMTGGR